MLFGRTLFKHDKKRHSGREILESHLNRYILALSIVLALILASHIVSLTALRQGAHDATAINMSGSQRMLLQQMSHAAHDYAEDGSPELRENLRDSIKLFETSHYELIRFGEDDAALQAIYSEGENSIHTKVLELINNVNWVLVDRRNTSAALEAIEYEASGPLANRLGEAADAFEAQANKRAEWLGTIQTYTVLALVLTIVAEVFLVFWPAHKIMIRAFKKLDQQHSEAQATLKRLSNFSAVASDLFWETDLQGKLIYAEGTFLQKLQGGRNSLVGCNYLDIIQFDEENSEIMTNAVQSAASYARVRGIFTDVDGQTYHMDMAGAPCFDDKGRITGYIGTSNDITAQVEKQEEVRKLAYSDPLTHLANKRALEERLPTMLAEASNTAPLFILALDLDGFKAVNDTYGHGAGDEVLKVVAARMKAIVRDSDLTVRTGGDEFFIVCSTSPSRLAVEGLALRLKRKLSEPYGLSTGHRVRISTSIGIAAAPFDCMGEGPLLHAADMALYEAKRCGRNQFRFYEDLGPFVVDEQAMA
ncbi:diguanylate cyclase [uncultured Hyphomonas sp.]|uniref:diguanylate cyclase domain-containing protein n=1 Tax=uncultured Hyphomonas sp. TaxID=225298 RepID=UPI0026361150|nr:diguanylate cyclase [uncultured Hyphomonas sp.]